MAHEQPGTSAPGVFGQFREERGMEGRDCRERST